MSEQQSITFTTPVGRLVWGSLTRAKTKDGDGNPLVIKHGPDAGKPTQRYEFGIAIPKGEADWRTTEWGKCILQAAQEGFPQGQWQSPTFAWKVTDGDSMIPNKRGRIPSKQEGQAGHWVLAFSSSFAPTTVDAKGEHHIDPAQIKNGHYVQVNGSIVGNGSSNQPGVYLNHRFVAHAGFGKEIQTGPDASQAGFGKAALPPGASATPIAALPAGQASAAPAPSQAATVAPPPTAAVAVTPHKTFLTPAPPPTQPVGPIMTDKANGVPYAQWIGAGWTHAQLVEHGYVRAA